MSIFSIASRSHQSAKIGGNQIQLNGAKHDLIMTLVIDNIWEPLTDRNRDYQYFSKN